MRQPLHQVLPKRHRAFGLGAMTAALVIVPVSPASARTTSVQGGQRPRVSGGTRTTAGERPWTVRLSTGCGAATDTAQRELTAAPGPGSTGNDSGRNSGHDSGRNSGHDSGCNSGHAPSPGPGRLASVPAYRTAYRTF